MLPDPSYPADEKEAVGSTAHQLGMDAGKNGDAIDAADPVFGGAVKGLSEDAAAMGGTAMNTFHDDYAARLATVFRNQAVVAEVLGHAVVAEQRGWTSARKT